jgi:hypothetical protein
MLRRVVVSTALLAAAFVGCATGVDPDRFMASDPTIPPGEAGAPTAAQGSRDAGRVSSDPGSDAAADAAPDVVTSGTVTCAGYAYPETVIVPSVSCTGWASGCTGAHEFRVVGCFTAPPSPPPCPAGFQAAAMGLIGQWAAAGNVARLVAGRACVYANGSGLATACGGDAVHHAYCWTKGAACEASCGSQCCEGYPTSLVEPCAQGGYEAPVLCVK